MVTTPLSARSLQNNQDAELVPVLLSNLRFSNTLLGFTHDNGVRPWDSPPQPPCPVLKTDSTDVILLVMKAESGNNRSLARSLSLTIG